MNDATINIKLQGLRQIKTELRELQYELSQATDPEQMAELAAKAGELQDNINRANEQARIFAAGSPFEQTSNALGAMNSQLMSLDFEGAAESAKLFATAAKGITPQLIGTQLKSLGSVVMSLGKAFMSVGMSLLANPIFLIAAAVAAIVGVIVMLLSKLGLLKPILQAIGKVFGWIKDAIDAVVQSIKDFLDWIGLTTFAADEMAQANIDAAQKTQEAYKEQSSSVIDGLDREIRVRQAAGKDTYDLEKQKQKVIAETAMKTLESLKNEIIARAKLGDVTKEEIKALQDKVAEQKKILKDANTEIQVLEAGHTKKLIEEGNKANEARKAAIEKQKEAERKANEDRIKREDEQFKLMQDLTLKGVDKEIADLVAAYEAKFAIAEGNAELEKMLVEQQRKDIAEIEKKYDDEEKARRQKVIDDANKQLLEDLQKDAEAKEKKKQLQKEYNDARMALGGDLVKGLQGLDNLLQAAGVKTAGLQKTIALVQIATDTAKAISATIAGAASAAAAGGPAAPFLLAGYIASGIGTILSAVASAWAALKKAPPVGGAVSGGAPTAPAATTTAATPNVSLFGQNNNANNLTSAQSVESNQNIVVQAVVSETEMTATQNKVKKIQQNATL